MSDSVFIDTNILLYLYSEDEAEKRRRSNELIDSHKGIISLQVVNEFSNTLRRKFKFEYDVINSAIKELSDSFIIVPQNLRTIFSALRIGKRYGYSYYDSLIIATAIENGCATLYSEDCQHGQVIDGALEIINPYT